MNKQDIIRRLHSIEDGMNALKEERRILHERLDMEHKWTEEAVRKRITDAVKDRYGSRVKVAIFKVNSEYDDQGYEYHPSLILVDSDFQEVLHNIDADQFIPSEREARIYYDLVHDDIAVKDMTIKF